MLVVNPHATTTTATGRDVLASALSTQLKLDVVHTDSRGHAAELATKAARDGFDLIVVHGGDGTVNEVVNGLLTDGVRAGAPALAVVPGGSANVFGGAIGVSRDPIEATGQLLYALQAGRRRTVGLGRVASDNNGTRWFTFNAGLGLDARAVERVEKDRERGRRATTARYIRAAIMSYFDQDHRHPLLTLQLPGEQPISGIYLAIVANAHPYSFAGNRPVRMNPGTSLERGLGVFALSSLRLPTVLRHTAQILRGRGEPHGRRLVRRDDVAQVTVTSHSPVGLQVDGDYLGPRQHARFESVPNALTVVV
ncbi:MAG TPA: diacylglycerol kinase family protein [Pseudonocardiaceae bacterium]|nr:diacylglycerol kinase family protein [Pseudonocardiaceae bacterium]